MTAETMLTSFDRGLLLFLCGASVTITVVLIGLIVWSFLPQKNKKNPTHRKSISFLWICLFLLLSVWTLRYAVNYYLMRYSTLDDDRALTGFEQIFNSFVHALQTFSMDESYTEYIRNGKEMMQALTGSSGAVWFYGIYASVLNLAAPIAGGAILFQILTSFFPHVRLFLGAHARWKQIILFSELNERSMVLAKSILRDYDSRAMIVFANVETASDEMEKTDLIESAKLIGAVCIKYDLTNLHLHIHGPRILFFMDQKEMLNLDMLLTMAAEDECNILRKASIYLFADATLYERVEKQFYAALRQKGYSDDEMPLTLPICPHQNLVFNLLTKMPLFEPLLPNRTCKAPRELRLTIMGMGRIGTEMLLDAYWCGQMLDCKLFINVISKDPEEKFWAKLDAINPDLNLTINRLCSDNPAQKQAENAKKSILSINGKGETAEPYCTIQYYQADLESDSLRTLLRMEPKNGAPSLLDTDYFAVTLGADDRNLRVANILHQECGRKHLEYLYQHADEDVPVPHTLIAYAVYDSALCDSLNKESLQSSAFTNSNDIYLYAFGSRKDEYSADNIMFPEHVINAVTKSGGFLKNLDSSDIRKEMSEYRAGYLENKNAGYYNLWANIARLTHTKYKMFSVGLRMRSVFLPDEKITWQQSFDAFSELVQENGDLTKLEPIRNCFIDGAIPKTEEERTRLRNEYAWLEHRRWCAFLRTRSYQHTEAHDIYHERASSHKELRLRLHPCLVECDKNGFHKNLKDEIEACGNDQEKLDTFDRLDLLAYHLNFVYKSKSEDGETANSEASVSETANSKAENSETAESKSDKKNKGEPKHKFKQSDLPDRYLEKARHFIKLFHPMDFSEQSSALDDGKDDTPSDKK